MLAVLVVGASSLPCCFVSWGMRLGMPQLTRKLRHLGVPTAPARSTLAYANTDYQWFTSLTQQGVYFVTRLKENADYGVVEKREVPSGRDVLRDEVVFFYKLEQQSKEAFYRRIEFYEIIPPASAPCRSPRW